MGTLFTKLAPTLIILMVISANQRLAAQNSCSEILDQAELLFEQGIIEEIPEILSGCIKDGFSPEEKVRAQKLLILTYIFDNNIPEAEAVLFDFLKDNPEYVAAPDDPAEFVLLLSGFRTIPYLSVGMFTGGNLSAANMVEHYGPYNPGNGKGSFAMNAPGFQIGAAVNAFLTDWMEVNAEALFEINSFTYSNVQYGFAEVNLKETHQRFEFPVTATFYQIHNEWMPYLRAGMSYGILTSASGNFRRSYINNDVSGPLESLDVDITGRRRTGFVNLIAGAGIKYKIPRGHVYFDLRYYYGLSQKVIPEGRWQHDEVFQFFTSDSNFFLDHLAFSLGYRYSFFRPVKRR